MSKLSVIICVYNTELNLLNECLKSIFDSSLKDIEVVFVDDGSSIDYSSLLRNYVKVKYIKTENKGTLEARLTGIENSTSKFIAFVDSDDTVSFNYLEAMLAWQDKTQADIVINDWAFSTKNAKYICKTDSTISKNFIVKNDLILKRFFSSKGREQSYHILWNKLYKKELLLKAVEKIRTLNLGHFVFSEDMLISFFAFKYAKCVSNVHFGYYFYRLHNSSECSKESKEKIENHFQSLGKVFDIIEDELKHDDIYYYVEENFMQWKALEYKLYRQLLKRNKYDESIKSLDESIKVDIKKFKAPNQNYKYAHQKLLPDNLFEIEDQLKKIYYNNKYLKVYAKKGTYAYKSLISYKLLLEKRVNISKRKKNSDIIVVKEKYKFKNRLLHNYLVYKLGMMLFPKGSKFRKKIKSNV